ncbi:MAG: cyclic nucleotide-binding domain-containing protein [Sphingobacteriaceae bacterium]|nr:cyclic nucleotide-binding domain-containing protein [Sphingobacteriaceae bacterium]
MLIKEILSSLGQFSSNDILKFREHIVQRTFRKNEIILERGAICQSVYFILSGSFFQYQSNGIAETIIDLHVTNEWMFNHTSLIEQRASETTIKAFEKSEVIELSLSNLHSLIARSPSFLFLAKIFNQTSTRTYLFDSSFNPIQKYNYIKNVKPLIVQVFPVKMIASYLKIAPETLSRVRANH